MYYPFSYDVLMSLHGSGEIATIIEQTDVPGMINDDMWVIQKFEMILDRLETLPDSTPDKQTLFTNYMDNKRKFLWDESQCSLEDPFVISYSDQYWIYPDNNRVSPNPIGNPLYASSKDEGYYILRKNSVEPIVYIPLPWELIKKKNIPKRILEIKDDPQLTQTLERDTLLGKIKVIQSADFDFDMLEKFYECSNQLRAIKQGGNS